MNERLKELFRMYNVPLSKIQNLDDMLSHEWKYERSSDTYDCFSCENCGKETFITESAMKKASRVDRVTFYFKSCSEELMDEVLG